MKYEVVVVGAGPAGSTAAKVLAEKGIKVLLIDKSKFPRDKPCGGGIPFRVYKRFPYIEDKNLIESYSYGGFAHSPSLKYRAVVEKDEPFIGMIIRNKFDDELVQLAVNSGADFIGGKAVEDIEISEEKAKLILDDNKEVNSELVIGADGVWSIVAKKSGLIPQTGRKIAICVFQEYKVGEETIDQFFDEKKMCHLHSKFQGVFGYGWVFPKKQHLNIGIGNISSDMAYSKTKINLSHAYREYLKILKKNKIIPEFLEAGKFKGGALNISPFEKTYSNRVLLCGDAAGFINPLTGEGIYYAMSSGEIAAKVALESLEIEDTSEKFLSIYQTKWKDDFGKDLEEFLRIHVYVGDHIEKFVRLASKDKKLADVALSILHGGLSIHDHKIQLAYRIFLASLKDIFSRNI